MNRVDINPEDKTMISNTKPFAIALLIALIGAPVGRAAAAPTWMSEVDFMIGNWVQDDLGDSTLTVTSETKPTALTIKHRTANAGAVAGHLVDATSKQHIYETNGKLQADEQVDDLPHSPLQTHFTTVSIVPNKSIILTSTTDKAAETGVEISYWACEWDPKKLFLSYAIKRAKLMPFSLGMAVFSRH